MASITSLFSVLFFPLAVFVVCNRVVFARPRPKAAGALPTERPPVIERFPNGYPRLAALLSSGDGFLIFRRFKRLRARLLLIHQNRIIALEKELERIDDKERQPIWHGTSQYDGNAERHKKISQIEEQLLAFDRIAQSTHETLRYDNAQPRDIESLKNWLSGNGSVARQETAYLSHDRDLFSIAPTTDDAMVSFESWVEDRLIRIPWYRKWDENQISEDPSVHFYSTMVIRRLAMGLLVSLIAFMIFLPIIICNVITGTASRMCIVMLSTILYLSVLSELTRAKTNELVLAATTYATVLIIFVTGTGAPA